MRDWTIDYIFAVLEKKEWSANRLAEEAGVAASTINRPLRERDNPNYKISRNTIHKIFAASGVDPGPYIPAEMKEEKALYSGPRPKSSADRALENLTPANQGLGEAQQEAAVSALHVNEIKVATVGKIAQIVATVDRDGLAKLRKKLDAIEAMLDD